MNQQYASDALSKWIQVHAFELAHIVAMCVCVIQRKEIFATELFAILTFQRVSHGGC